MIHSKVLYVDDEETEPIASFAEVLRHAGFEVVRAKCASEAEAFVASDEGQELGLVVLDRKIPVDVGGVAAEAVGDGLFAAVNERLTDIPIIVLSGYTDEEHARWVLQRPGDLFAHGAVIRRFQHYRKGDSLEFQQAVAEVGHALVDIEAIELRGAGEDRSVRRLLKRVGQTYGGTLVRAAATEDGLSTASVWLCDVLSSDGRSLARLVVKVGSFGSAKPTGGFLASIRHNMRATPTEVIGGFCGGLAGVVAPLAGSDAKPLNALLRSSEADAGEVATEVLAELSRVPSAQRLLPLSEVVAPLVAWPDLVSRLESAAIAVPASDLAVNVSVSQVHGDLHPGNILFDAEQGVCIIDFDSQFVGSAAYDALTLGLGAIFHKAGGLRENKWDGDSIVSVLHGGDAADATGRWVERCVAACAARELAEGREYWAVLLAYASRQLGFPDVIKMPALRELAGQIAAAASEQLQRY